MANQIELGKLSKHLRSALPIIGAMKRRKAVEILVAQKDEPEHVPLLLEAATGKDQKLALQARAALESLANQEAKDALCALALRDANGLASQIAVDKGYRHSDYEQDCLFLFLSRQLDLYFQDNEYGRDEFETLRQVYDSSEPAVRERVREIVRSGDNRYHPFAVRPRKSQILCECNDAEIKLAIQSCLRHKDWARLFAVTLELPMKYAFPLLDVFRQSGWEPPAPELKSLYRQILTDSQGQTFELAEEPSATSSVFERWLAEGRKGELAQMSETDLMNKLKEAIPPDGVKIVSALAAKPKLAPATIEAVAKSEHWLVRMAGLVTGISQEVLKDIGQDSNYWVNELAGMAGVLELWPAKATPADLEKLRTASAAAFTGKLGAVRKVLRTILDYHVLEA